MSEGWGRVYAEMMGLEFAPIPFLTFSGTWAPPGWGYPSDVVNGVDDLLACEIPVQAPWSFGPVGGPDLTAPSYEQSVDIAHDWSCNWIDDNSGPFGMWSYSQGAEAGSRVLRELQTGSLTSRMKDFIGGGTFGNPMRQKGHTGPGLTEPGGRGIAPEQLTGTPLSWVDVANKGDMYTTTPATHAGDYITDFYSLFTKMQLGDFGKFTTDLITSIATGILPDVLGLLTNPITLIPAAQAGIIALTFLGQGTAPHIEYHLREVQPGVTGLQYAINHTNSIIQAHLKGAP